MKVAWSAEVMVGAASTVRVKLWVALGVTPLAAVMVIGKVPLAVGVPDRRPADEKRTPVGSVPTSVKVGAGDPVAVTVKVPARALGEGGVIDRGDGRRHVGGGHGQGEALGGVGGDPVGGGDGDREAAAGGGSAGQDAAPVEKSDAGGQRAGLGEGGRGEAGGGHGEATGACPW